MENLRDNFDERESSDDESVTLDYRDFEDARSEDDDDEPDHHAFNEEEELFQVIAEGHLHAFLNECGTQVEEAAIEALDVQNGANECWSFTEPDEHCLLESGAAALTEPVEVKLTHQMSMLLVPTDGENAARAQG